jgi:hypothetical protein
MLTASSWFYLELQGKCEETASTWFLVLDSRIPIHHSSCALPLDVVHEGLSNHRRMRGIFGRRHVPL